MQGLQFLYIVVVQGCAIYVYSRSFVRLHMVMHGLLTGGSSSGVGNCVHSFLLELVFCVGCNFCIHLPHLLKLCVNTANFRRERYQLLKLFEF